MTTESVGSEPRRLTGWRRVVLWLALAVEAALFVAAALVMRSAFPVPIIGLPIVLGTFASFGAVGAIVATHQPRNAMGWILWAAASAILPAQAAWLYATYSVQVAGGALPGTVPIAVIAGIYVPFLGIIGIYVPLLFPDGHLPSPRWRPVAWLGALAITLTTVIYTLIPGPLSNTGVDNPLGLEAFEDMGDWPTLWLGLGALGLLAAAFVLAAASVVVRYRGGDVVKRQQLRWFGAAVAVMVGAMAAGTSNVGPMKEFGAYVAIAGIGLLPIAVGIAILRYRLYDIDRVISRTISYATVTAILVVTFGAAILLFQTLVTPLTGGNSVGVAASTLFVAALFQPLRRRVQRVVDRRFNRARYDAERTATAFSARMRDEVDLTNLSSDLDTTIRHAIAPRSLGIWLRESR